MWVIKHLKLCRDPCDSANKKIDHGNSFSQNPRNYLNCSKTLFVTILPVFEP